MNNVKSWLQLIGTPERAKKLRARLDSLSSPKDLDPNFGPEPFQCPTTVLFGAETSRKLYTDSGYRPALDAWDTQEVSKGDLRRYCLWIERGEYTGPIFYPDASWQARLRSVSTANASRLALRRQTLEPRPWESRGSLARAKLPALLDIVRRS